MQTGREDLLRWCSLWGSERARGSQPPPALQASSESLCLLFLSYEGGIDPQRRVNSVSTGSPSQPALPAFALLPGNRKGRHWLCL